MQNADDASDQAGNRLLFRLVGDTLIAANTGGTFTYAGMESLVISDTSPKQLHRSRCIGNKGLGFRSVLSWSDEPLILSGPHTIAFSQRHARAAVEKLGAEVEAIGKLVAEWEAAEQTVPAPVMRFPYRPPADSPALKLAESVRAEGFDTVIVLPLRAEQIEAVRAELAGQLQQISGDSVLFCYHLEQLMVEADALDLRRSWSLIRDGSSERQTIIIDGGSGQTKMWEVHRRIGELPASVIDGKTRETPQYEIAVAVPETLSDTSSNRLCVFFPTDDVLPTALLAHATLATDDSRKRLVSHAANRHVLKSLAELIAEVAEAQSHQDHERGLVLLSGVERCDNELVELGFGDAVVAAAKNRRLLPRLDGTLSSATDARTIPHPIWRDVSDKAAFPEMLSLRNRDAAGVVTLLGVPAYTERELAEKLETMLSAMEPERAGDIVGRLLREHQLPTAYLGDILRADDGKPIDADHTVFLQPEVTSVRLPEWATTLHFLHAGFADAVRKTSGIGTGRDLRSKLAECGYEIEEFQFEALARRLEEVAYSDQNLSPEEEANRCRTLLSTLFQLSRGQVDAATIRANVHVLTDGGTRRAARSTYLSRSYPGGILVDALYRPLGVDEFIADASSLGFAGQPLPEVEEFLKRLGVADKPRMRVATDLKASGLTGFINHVLEQLTYPNRFLDTEVTSEHDLEAKFSGIRIAGLTLPDRISELLMSADAEPLVAFLAAEGASLLADQFAVGCILHALTGSQRSTREYPAVRIPNPLVYLLRNFAWVLCSDGVKRSPTQIILTRAGGNAFVGTFFRHVLGASVLLQNRGGRATVDSVLMRLGAVNSLDSVSTETFYELLLNLPKRDPTGANAASIYRTLLEAGGFEAEAQRRDRFVKEGKMWGRRGTEEQYFPVQSLRYWSRGTLPRPLRQIIPLVAIDPRKNSKEIHRLFGVETLRADDFTIEIKRDATEFADWTGMANSHVIAARPFLYALRLSQRADDDGRQRRVLAKTQLHICKRMAATVEYGDQKGISVAIDEELDGITIGAAIYLVSSETEFVGNDLLFWRAVADLLADLLEAGTHAGDFASLLMADTQRQRIKLLDRMTDGRGESLLNQAREALNMPPDEEFEDAPIPIPPAENPATKDGGTTPSSRTAGPSTPPLPTEPAPNEPANDNKPTFNPVDAPTTRRSERRGLVVVRAKNASGATIRVQLIDEEETLEIVEQFEQAQGRYPIKVYRIRGYDGPRCDIVSVLDANIREAALRDGVLDNKAVARFIEVKGRSQRTGAVQLTDNELGGAQEHGSRYFVYRVFCDPLDDRQREVAVLQDPVASPALKMQRTATINLDDNSGADWFSMEYGPAGEQPQA